MISMSRKLGAVQLFGKRKLVGLLAAPLLSKRQWVGLFIAPLAAPIASFLIIHVNNYFADPDQLGFMQSMFEIAFLLLAMIFFGAPIFYGVAVTFGILILKILEKIDKVNFFSIVMSSGILGTVPVIAIFMMDVGGNIPVHGLWFAWFLIFFDMGLIVGTTFWFIVYSPYRWYLSVLGGLAISFALGAAILLSPGSIGNHFDL